jgi:uncharacterized protein
MMDSKPIGQGSKPWGRAKGPVAQLVERWIEDPSVGGSNPSRSTIKRKVMNRVFKKVDGQIIDIVSHTLSVLKDCPYAEIHVGSDSQNHRRHTVYSTVIAYRYGNRGVHYVVHKERIKKIKDRWTRLWKEAEMSIETAELLTSKVSVQVQIDLDFNVDERYFSSRLVQAASGWASSLGYRVNIKPDNQVATKAADHHCR